jgi:hypothetical protein
MRITAIALGLVLGSTVPVVAQEERSGAPHEGIKVHGHWTIEVREPDGRLVSHREFENALLDEGQTLLAGLLGRGVSSPIWLVRLEHIPRDNPNLEPCDQHPVGGQPAPCYIIEPTSDPIPENNVFKNLQLQVLNQNTLQLAGSATAFRSTSIGRVSSRFQATQLPSGQAISSYFTAKDLATPVPVVAGQIIQVTVLFSFS